MSNNEEKHDVVTGEIVRSSNPGITTAEDPLVIIEKRNKLMDRLLDAAIRATDSSQWVDMQGKPFPTAAACEIMARRCGVRIFDVDARREERNDEDGESYIYFTTGKVQLGNSEYDIIEAIGTCSSRDQFIGTNPKEGKDTNRLQEVDEGNIMKASYSNFIVNGVSRLLGVRNKTWVQLKAFNIEQGGAGRVDFASGSRGGGQGKPATFPYGDNKDLQPSDPKVADKDLTWWATRLAEDLTKPDKAKFKAGNERLLAAVKEEMAKRANTKAGTTAPAKNSEPTFWERLKQLATAQNVPEDKLKAVTRQVLKTPEKESVNPGALTEQNFKDIADAIELTAKEIASKSGEAGF